MIRAEREHDNRGRKLSRSFALRLRQRKPFSVLR
jgi:hypothetical protein